VARARTGFTWLSSDYILAETAAVLTRKHIQARYGKWATPAQQARFLADARAVAELIEVRTTLVVVSQDVKDNPVLACAVDGHADYLVSGDPHLTSLGEYVGIKIVGPAQFLAVLQQVESSG
jgi:putative PIN family toxin of toxin-antitoxin system